MEAADRHELKCNINHINYVELRSKLPYIMNYDINANKENSYRVKSLYFDNYRDKALMEKIFGINNREKFRLRLYNDDSSLIRLEKKVKETISAVRKALWLPGRNVWI